MFPELNQNALSFDSKIPASLQSPNIFAYKACFTFQYKAGRYWDEMEGSQMFVYVQKAGHWLPVYENKLYYGNSKWNTVKIQISIETGFTQVSFLVDDKIFLQAL